MEIPLFIKVAFTIITITLIVNAISWWDKKK